MALGYDLADSPAAKMLTAALQRAQDERGLSVRTIGKMLGYKQAVVLSHMALGRVGIPIDRAEEIAEVLLMDKADFLRQVVEQRHPEVRWDLLTKVGSEPEEAASFSTDLEIVAGRPLRQLSPEHKAVLREVVGSQNPRRRWLSDHEIPAIELLRSARPGMRERGLHEDDRISVRRALEGPRR